MDVPQISMVYTISGHELEAQTTEAEGISLKYLLNNILNVICEKFGCFIDKKNGCSICKGPITEQANLRNIRPQLSAKQIYRQVLVISE